MSYVINEYHILSLKNTFAYDEYNIVGKVVNIPVKEYLQINENTPFKKYYKGYRYKDDKIIFSDLDISYKGEGEYFGFTIDGNHLFMLEDMTVTHNTTELLRRLSCDSAIGRKVLYINHSIDDRSKDEAYSTHNSLYKEKLGSNISTIFCSNLPSIEEIIEYDTIGIDEGQFFEDLSIIQSYVEKCNKRVIICGLVSNSNRKRFGNIIDLIPIADQETRLYASCVVCAKELKIPVPSVFTHRVNKEHTETVFVGGADDYIPVCRKHYLKLNDF
jgi:thymidine kinase